MTRAHLEALLVAAAAVHRDRAAELAREIDRERVSPAAGALVDVLVAGVEFLHPRSNAERELIDRAGAITINELLEYSSQDLVALANTLPTRLKRVSAMHFGAEAAA